MSEPFFRTKEIVLKAIKGSQPDPRSRFLVIFMLGLGVPGWLLAQSEHCAIAGNVADSSGAILQGAEVTLQPTRVKATSNPEGNFGFTDLAPGDYKIQVTYVGFSNAEVSVTCKASEVGHADVRLQVESANDTVTVTAERAHGEVEAINRTRTADNILQVLPAEVITSLPNANVADALGRLPSITLARSEGEGVYIQVRGTEPRLTNVMIDGITTPSPEPNGNAAGSGIRLDVIPADLVESVEINKTLAPNIDGDGIGGSVNLKTKTAGEFPTLNLYGIGGYNPILEGRYNDQWGGTIGHRFGPQKKLGLLFNGSYDFNGRGIDNFQPAIDPTSTFARPYYDNDTIREYRYYRNRWGFGGTADYKFNDFSTIYFKGLYSNLQDYGDKWYYEPEATSAPAFYTSSKRPDVSISSYTLGGRQQFTTSAITWQVSAARSYELDSAGNPKADFAWIGPSLICGYDPSTQTNPNQPHFGSGCDGPNSPLQNAADWGFKDITTSTGLTSQLNLSAQASYSKQYQMGKYFGIFEFGGKFRNAHKFQNATETVYDGWTTANYPMTMFLDTFSSNNYMSGDFFGGHYGPVSNFNQLQAFTLANLASYVDGLKTASDTYPNQFDIIERISAGYLMDTMDFGKWHIMGGLRIEGTQLDTLGYNVQLYGKKAPQCPTSPTGCGIPVPVTNNPSYVNFLPSISARYALTQSSGIRLVYGRGVSRPDPYQLVPYAVENDSTNPATVSIGNPALKPEHANNFDALYEHYLNPVGLIQAGFFYKQLSDTMISTTYTATSGLYQGDPVTQWLNVGDANLLGFEASYQQRLSWLPGALAGFGFFGNYTYTWSQVQGIPGRTDRPTLQSQVPNSWNLSPTYDRKRLSVRVGLSYNGRSLYQYEYQTAADVSGLGPHGPSGDIYYYPHLQLDAQASYRIGYGLTALVYGLNITNEVFGFYQGSPIFVNQREWYKATIAGGLRYKLNRER